MMEYRIVVVGTSLGGWLALKTLLSSLPEDYALPLAVVQHRSANSDGNLRITLQRYSALRLREPEDKETIQPGKVYLAPANYHLLVEEGFFSLSTEGAVCYARPSIDVLFESAADAYGDAVIAIVMTGANHDGAHGAAAIKNAGGFVMVQEPETAESAVLPRAVLAATPVDRVLSLSQISPQLVQMGPSRHG